MIILDFEQNEEYMFYHNVFFLGRGDVYTISVWRFAWIYLKLLVISAISCSKLDVVGAFEKLY